MYKTLTGNQGGGKDTVIHRHSMCLTVCCSLHLLLTLWTYA